MNSTWVSMTGGMLANAHCGPRICFLKKENCDEEGGKRRTEKARRSSYHEKVGEPGHHETVGRRRSLGPVVGQLESLAALDVQRDVVSVGGVEAWIENRRRVRTPYGKVNRSSTSPNPPVAKMITSNS